MLANPRLCTLFGLFIAALPTASLAQSSPARPCSDAAHRQFDFWIGEWRVLDTRGNVAGTNVIQPTLDGCAITEAWSSGNTRGFSINFYDASAARWHQTWIDNAGRPLYLDGAMRDGAMILEGSQRLPDGREARQRITWSRLPRGEVRQLWESSTDAGQTWSTVFDGRYVASARSP